LTREGYTVSTRDHVKGVVEDLIKDKPDLVILDVMFPDNPAGGFDTARKIRKHPATRDIPVILLTNVNQMFPMDFSAQDIDPDWMPVQDFIEKPPETKALLKKIRKLLNSRNRP
jgi:CheY-like chemotaxis protein